MAVSPRRKDHGLQQKQGRVLGRGQGALSPGRGDFRRRSRVRVAGLASLGPFFVEVPGQRARRGRASDHKRALGEFFGAFAREQRAQQAAQSRRAQQAADAARAARADILQSVFERVAHVSESGFQAAVAVQCVKNVFHRVLVRGFTIRYRQRGRFDKRPHAADRQRPARVCRRAQTDDKPRFAWFAPPTAA